MTQEKKPLDHVLEAAIYAPIGFALEAKRLLPEFVERGRQQVNMAKMVGQFAVNHGQATAAKQVTKLQEQADALLHEFGIGHGEGGSVAGTAAKAPAAASVTAPVDDQREAPEVLPPSDAPSPDELPIADYDSLAASQVIPRLDGLKPGELEAVRAYEASNRGRKTILGKIAQLSDG